MVKRLSMLMAGLFLVVGGALAQTHVSGTVTSSDDGEPVIGAAIVIAGTNTGTVTDVDGNFELTIPQGVSNKLVVSYVGMASQTVTGRENMKIALKSDQHNLDEVMVVAYGTQRRSTFTGSAGLVKSEDISKHVVSTATDALSGSVAGVQLISSSGEPGSSPSINIRGIGSYTASTEPLYIVDGAPFDGEISSINPADILEITVLKDAASAAIYGARGSNGVVIITTKKAKGAGAAKVTFDAKWGSNNREIPRYDVITNPGEYYETWFKAMYNSQYLHGATADEAYQFASQNLLNRNNGGLGYLVYTVPTGENLIGKNFKLNPNAKIGYSDGEYYYQPDDWYNYINHHSFRQEYNAGVSGSTDKLSYYANVGFLSDGGIVENSSFKRYTARSNVDYQAKKWLRLTTNIDYAHIDSKSPAYDATEYGSSGNVFSVASTIAPIYPIYVRNADGSFQTNGLGDRVYDANQTNFARPALQGNAIGDNHYNKTDIGTDQFRGNWVATITPVDGLNLAANFTAFNRNTDYHYLLSRFSTSGASVDGQAEVVHTRDFSTNQLYTANYDKTFGKHGINAIFGYEHYNSKESELDGYNDHLFDPFIAELGNAYGTSNKDVTSYTNHLVRDGYFFRGDYNYDELYNAEFSIRRDGSSKFAPHHRWGTFWSVSGAWSINKEKWFKADWVDLLKLKLSYGEQGNDNFSYETFRNYYLQPWSDFYSVTYDETTHQYTSQLSYRGNTDLTWEKSGEWNLGVDFSFWKNRLSGSFEIFHKKTHDLLYLRTLPLSSGIQVTSYPDNVGAMVNKGIEFTVNGDIIRTKSFTWNANANITAIKTKMTELDPDIAENGLIGNSTILRVGGSRYEAYMYKYAGADKTTGQALYYQDQLVGSDGEVLKNSNGSLMTAAQLRANDRANGTNTPYTINTVTTTDITTATQYDLGDMLPDAYGGFGMNFTWKPGDAGTLDFGFQFSYQFGGKGYDGGYQQLCKVVGNAGAALHKDVLKGWDPVTNPNGNFPVLSTAAADDVSGQSSIDRYLTSSDYLSLNNLTLGYSFPKTWIQKLALSNLRVYFAGENLFIATARKGFDPRTSVGGGSYTSGSALISNGGYAAMRSVTAGIQLTF